MHGPCTMCVSVSTLVGVGVSTLVGVGVSTLVGVN